MRCGRHGLVLFVPLGPRFVKGSLRLLLTLVERFLGIHLSIENTVNGVLPSILTLRIRGGSREAEGGVIRLVHRGERIVPGGWSVVRDELRAHIVIGPGVTRQ